MQFIKKCLKYVHNRRHGFGLVEVMLAVSIAGGLALMLAKLMDNTLQGTKQIEAKSESIYLKGSISNILSNQQACGFTFSPLITQANLATLSAAPTNSITVPGIRDRENTTVYSTASTNIAPLRITSMLLTRYNPGTGAASLIINMNYMKSSSIVQTAKPIMLGLNFNIDNTVPASPTLLGCSTSDPGNAGADNWQLAGNSGTDPLTNYIGTSDNQPLMFRVNGTNAGRIVPNGTVAFGSNAAGGTGTSNVALGTSALSTGTGNWNIGIGVNALMGSTGTNNVAIGYLPLQSNTSGASNVAVGQQTLMANTTGSNNVAIGSSTLQSNTSGFQNIAVGPSALRSNTTGLYNVAIGLGALQNNTVNSWGVAIGQYSQRMLNATTFTTNQNNNVGVGASTLEYTTTGNNNTAIGMGALRQNTAGQANTALGLWSLANSTTGNDNVALGASALISNTLGSGNVAVGHSSVHDNTTGSNNVGIGRVALQENTTGVDNVALGVGACNKASTGNNNICLGAWSGPDTAITGSNNIFIGHRAGLPTGIPGPQAQSNMLYITNTGTSAPLIRGNFATGEVQVRTILRQGSWYPPSLVGSTYTGYAILSDTSTSMMLGGQLLESNKFFARFANGYAFCTNANATSCATLSPNASAWNTSSDRNIKHDIRDVDFEKHLDKIEELPVFYWKYKEQETPHMGPMAQDFWSIFKLGPGDDKNISTQDMDGVLIAGVKGLEIRTRQLRQENEKLRERNLKLEERLFELEERFQRLEKLVHE